MYGPSKERIYILGGGVRMKMAASVNLVINETLCYWTYSFKKQANSVIKAAVLSCYSEDELTAAKELLHRHLCVISRQDAPRLIRRKGDNRGKLIVDDIDELFTLIDEKQLFGNIPTFVAANLDKLPPIETRHPFTPDLMKNVDDLKLMVHDRCGAIEKLVGNLVSSLHGQSTQTAGVESRSSLSSDDEVGKHDADKSNFIPGTEESWSKFVKRNRKSSVTKTAISSTKAPVPQQASTHSGMVKKIIGKASKDCGFKSSVKVIPKAVFHVDNVSEGCDASALENYLKSCKIDVLSVFSCKSWMNEKDTQIIKSFRIAVAAADRLRMQDGNIWPDGVFVRPWKFKGNDRVRNEQRDGSSIL